MESALNFMNQGGAWMWVIFGVWVFGVGISIERFIMLFRYDCDADSTLEQVRASLLRNDVEAAVDFCSKGNSLLPKVLRSGLMRISYPKNVVEDVMYTSALENINKVEKRTAYVQLVANVSTLIGLLGTIYGLIEAFTAIGAADASEKAKILAQGISTAMNTTALGLISAISMMVVYTFLTTKSDGIVAGFEEYSQKFLSLIKIENEEAAGGSGSTPVDINRKSA